MLDRGDVYRARTPAAITTFRRLAEQCGPTGRQRVRVVGEVDFGPTERDWLEWQRYEAVINEALAGWPLWGLCVFDTQRLPESAADRRAADPLPRRDHAAVARPTRGSPSRRTTSGRSRSRTSRWRRTPPRLHATHVADFASLRRALAAELAGRARR